MTAERWGSPAPCRALSGVRGVGGDQPDAETMRILRRVLTVVGGGGAIKVAFVPRQDVLIHLRQRYVATPTGPTTQLIVGYILVPQALQSRRLLTRAIRCERNTSSHLR